MSKILKRREYLKPWILYVVVIVATMVWVVPLILVASRFLLESLLSETEVVAQFSLANEFSAYIGLAIGIFITFIMFNWIVESMIVRKVESRVKQKLLQEYCEKFEKKNPLDKEEKNENEL